MRDNDSRNLTAQERAATAQIATEIGKADGKPLGGEKRNQPESVWSKGLERACDAVKERIGEEGWKALSTPEKCRAVYGPQPTPVHVGKGKYFHPERGIIPGECPPEYHHLQPWYDGGEEGEPDAKNALSDELEQEPTEDEIEAMKEKVLRMEKAKKKADVIEAFQNAEGNMKETAEALGISKPTLYKWLDELDLRDDLKNGEMNGGRVG